MQTYENDVTAWSSEQARLLREGRFDLLDIEHIADEIESVGKCELRELVNHMTKLITHLLIWQHQPGRRGRSWEVAIKSQRKNISYALWESPSLTLRILEPRWLDIVWTRAVAQAIVETGLDGFPGECPWIFQDEVLADTWLPE